VKRKHRMRLSKSAFKPLTVTVDFHSRDVSLLNKPAEQALALFSDASHR
jgi:hypothetical protein